jgi:hypothetical protein
MIPVLIQGFNQSGYLGTTIGSDSFTFLLVGGNLAVCQYSFILANEVSDMVVMSFELLWGFSAASAGK